MSPTHELLEGLSAVRQELVRECAAAAGGRDEAAYLVGGPVRDLILGRPVEDVDVVVVGDGLAVAQHVARALGGRMTRYHAFGTARVDLPDGQRLDVATARAEQYQRPGVLPEVRPGCLADDLSRRDFSINAMAIGLGGRAGDQLEDPLGGREDLAAGLIRFLHEGSFIDDPSRMLRAIRFALRFDYAMEPATERALEAGVQGAYLDSISGDRLRRELGKLLQEQPIRGPLLLLHSGLLATIDPRLRADDRTLDALAGEVAEHHPPAPTWTLVLASLAGELDVQARWQLARRLRLSRDDREALIDAGAPWQRALRVLRAEPRRSEVATTLDPLSASGIVVGLAALRSVGATAADAVDRYLRHDRDLRARLDASAVTLLGCPPGPLVGELLRSLRGARIDGRAPDADAERERAREWLRARQIDPPGGP